MSIATCDHCSREFITEADRYIYLGNCFLYEKGVFLCSSCFQEVPGYLVDSNEEWQDYIENTR